MNVDWAWRELKDAGEELPEAVVNSEDGDSGLQSQELKAEEGHVPTGREKEGKERGSYQGRRCGGLTGSEWTYSHRHGTVVAKRRWSNGRTDGKVEGGSG